VSIRRWNWYCIKISFLVSEVYHGIREDLLGELPVRKRMWVRQHKYSMYNKTKGPYRTHKETVNVTTNGCGLMRGKDDQEQSERDFSERVKHQRR